MDTFLEVEDYDGIRFSWNLWPCSAPESTQLVVPLACLYSPLKQSNDIPMVNFDPVQCPKCHALLNPFCALNLHNKFWTCVFCYNVTSFPRHYAAITEDDLPAEVHPRSTTIEYALSSGASGLSPAFIFVLDISVSPDELNSLVTAILCVLATLPTNSYVGLITYGSYVGVYELGFSAFPKVHIFEGGKEHRAPDIKRVLQLGAPPTNKNSFFLPLSAVDATLTSILEELSPDPRPHKPDEKPLRCTGSAIAIAVAILESTFQFSGARILLFCGGPATYGPGMVVGIPNTEQMRSHYELQKETAAYVHKASKYYTTLAEQAVRNHHAIDVFSCSLNQTGLLEMQETFKMTGGTVIMAESFKHKMFTEALKGLFKRDQKNFLKMGFDARIEVKTSKELAIHGGIGHFVSLANKAGNVSKREIGQGGTCEWRMSCLDPQSSYAFYFEVVNPKDNLLPEGKYGMIQIKTQYTHPTGQRVLRCTTVAHNWLPANSPRQSFLDGFDQEAAAAIVAKQIIHKASTEECDIQKWLDNHLIQFCKLHSLYSVGLESSVTFPPQMGMYPLFLYYLRRGCLVRTAGGSPDETVHTRYYLLKEATSNCLTMIQPALDQYSFDSPTPTPVPLSLKTMQQNCLLLLDTFFHVVVWTGSDFVNWRNAGYCDKPEFENLKALMEAPQFDAKEICKNRFPRPYKVVCDAKSPPERYLLSYLDPENSTSEDASLSRFLDLLKKYVVKSEK